MTSFFQKIRYGIQVMIRITTNALFLRFQKDVRLNIGAGGTRIKGYTNVDSLLLRETDLLSTIHLLPWFVRRESISEIYASHVLEHFSERDVRLVLRICYQLLQSGGSVRISVPDMDKIVKIYYKHWQHFQTPGNAPWNGLIYGGQYTKYDFHKTGFNACWLTLLLKDAGFTQIEEYDALSFTSENGFQDSSLANEPFQELISLNMIAYK